MTISPIYELIKADVDQKGSAFIKQKIEPWVFYNVKGVKIDKYDGTRININTPDFEFSGSSRLVFWDGYVDEELAALALSLFDATRSKALEHGVPIENSILDCRDCLSALVLSIFDRMAEIDQLLRGKGYPKSIPKENVHERALNLNRVIDKFAEAHIASAKSAKSNKMSKTSWLKFLELKPNFFGLGLNLNAVLSWVFKNKKEEKIKKK